MPATRSYQASLRSRKTSRMNLRTSIEQEDLLRTVAERRHQSLTEFVLQSACQVAEQELADETHFKLQPQAWDLFIKALERPAKVHPRLRRLFAEKSVLE